MNIGKLNPLAEQYKARFKNLPKETQVELEKFSELSLRDYQLKVIKRNRSVIEDGDVFILSPIDEIFFYGKVMKAKIVNENPFLQDNYLVFIFKNRAYSKNMDEFCSDYNNLLISPIIVSKSYWNRGFFYTIGNEPIRDEEKTLDYGLLCIDAKVNYFCKEDGSRLEHIPKIMGLYGMSTNTGVAKKIQRELIIDKTLIN